MKLNSCFGFVSDGFLPPANCDPSDPSIWPLTNTVYKIFSDIDREEKPQSFMITEFNFSSEISSESNKLVIGQLNLTLENNEKKSFKYTINKNDMISCFCETLLFLMVNFQITPSIIPVFLDALQLYYDCWGGYRYYDAIDNLLFYLDQKENTESIVYFLYHAWHHEYPKEKISFILTNKHHP